MSSNNSNCNASDEKDLEIKEKPTELVQQTNKNDSAETEHVNKSSEVDKAKDNDQMDTSSDNHDDATALESQVISDIHQVDNQNRHDEINDGDVPSRCDDHQEQTNASSYSLFDAFINSRNEDVSYHSDETDFLDLLLKSKKNKKLIDRLLGCAYGQALGDAYGLSTEFQTRTLVAQDYPDQSNVIPFPNYKLTGHSRRWRQGDWTDDTDQWILILETLTEDCRGENIEKIFAKKLTYWIRCGYPILGDHGGMGLGTNVAQVRTITELLCKTTHFDPRCIASCLAVCLTITYLLREEFDNNDIESLVERVREETLSILDGRLSDEYRQTFLWHIDKDRTLEELNLDEPSSIGYTFKCLASGFYGLRSTNSFEKTLNDLIRYGGDADTNGAVCGTMYGARHGYAKLPHDWLRATPFKKWFDKKIIKCLVLMQVVDMEDLKQ